MIISILLSDTINNPEVISLIQDQIDILETPEEEPVSDSGAEESTEDTDLGELFGDDTSGTGDTSGGQTLDDLFPETSSAEGSSDTSSSSTDTLPSPADLGIGDVSDSSNPEL